MNLLAHALLANGNPDRIVGQLCGDFVRGSNLDAFPEAIQAGIRCHRAVDTYTDSHGINLQARNLFEAPYRRFAGIVVDVIYDHFLANEWQKYHTSTLDDYTTLVSKALALQHHLLPGGLQQFAALLKREDTLHRNLDRQHIDLTLQRIAHRRKSLSPLATVADTMWAHEEQLKQSFDVFFPELLNYTLEYQQKQSSENDIGG